jgi:glycerophosphoryl diester phosphodiesterase
MTARGPVSWYRLTVAALLLAAGVLALGLLSVGSDQRPVPVVTRPSAAAEAPHWDTLPRGARVAHAGGAVLAPENTMHAFETAVSHGAPVLETDVHLLADGTLAVIHDPTLDRTTTSTGRVADLTEDEFDRVVCDAGAWFGNGWGDTSLPTLDDLLVHFGNRVVLFIDIKARAAAVPTLDLLDAHGISQQSVVILSFDQRDLVPAHERGWPTALLDTTDVDRTVADGVDLILPRQSAVTDALVDRAHASGLRVGTWTVDTPEELSSALGRGVDVVITNGPGLLPRQAARTVAREPIG